MDGLQTIDLVLFTLGAFGAAFVTGLAGFAFGVVAAAVWLHFLPPAQVTPLITVFALIIQGVSVWKLRNAINPRRILPFILGQRDRGAGWRRLLLWAPAVTMRAAVGSVLVVFALYYWVRPSAAIASRFGALADGMVGIVNGVTGDATGLAGLATVVCAIFVAGRRPS